MLNPSLKSSSPPVSMLPTWGNNEGIITHDTHKKPSPASPVRLDLLGRRAGLSESDGGQAMNATNSNIGEYHGKKEGPCH